MAQLPPKAPPNITHNYWPSFIPHHKLPSSMPNFVNSTTNGGGATTAAAGGGGGGVGGTTTAMVMSNNGNSNNNNQGCNWVDEFLDFSSVRRGAHRRSISDSIAFLDPPTMLLEEECRNSNGNAAAGVNIRETNCFDRLDDEQLMSMFSDDIAVSLPPTTASSSNPSTPSDQNSNNDDQKTTPLDPQQKPKNEPGEVESSCKSEGQNTQTQHTPAVNSNGDSFNIDPKRVKRILANRQSAQRSRVRKLQYISELERSVTTLQTEVSALSPRVAFLDHQRLILGVDNSALKQRIAALAQDKIFKDAHQEALKKEIERLRQIYHHQQQQNQLNKMENNNNNNNNNNSTELAAAAAPVQQPMNIDNHDHHQLLS